MKKALYVVLESNPKAYETLEDLKERGYNATVISSESLNKAVDYYPEEHTFFNLRSLEREEIKGSIMIIFVVEEYKLRELKDVIRWDTNNFEYIKGFMYSRTLEDYEGSV